MASFGDLPTEIAQKCVEFLAFDEMSWAGKLGKISDHLRARIDWVDFDLPNRESRRIAAALESWTDMKLAVQLLEESMEFGAGPREFTAKAHMWSANWKDKKKVKAFGAATKRCVNPAPPAFASRIAPLAASASSKSSELLSIFLRRWLSCMRRT